VDIRQGFSAKLDLPRRIADIFESAVFFPLARLVPAPDTRLLRHLRRSLGMATSATATQTEVNAAQSVMLMRNLMRVTFSNVVYTRGIFDESQFKPMNARDRLS
jgi:hypothetical protein